MSLLLGFRALAPRLEIYSRKREDIGFQDFHSFFNYIFCFSGKSFINSGCDLFLWRKFGWFAEFGVNYAYGGVLFNNVFVEFLLR